MSSSADNTPTTADGPTVWRVSELNQLARNTLERHFSSIHVSGEITDLLQHRSGHWYFTLKDDSAQLRVAMFRSQNRSVRTSPENGQEVTLKGKLSLYAPRGSFQFIADRMTAAGQGKLQQAFDALKQQLGEQGLFASKHKQALPELPSRVILVTSPQGAAIRDIQSTFARRFSAIELILIPVAVQGDGAAEQIAAAIELANRWSAKQSQPAEAMIIGRGGGSMEDLWAFNEAVLAQAIHRSQLPIISAVGHETDVTIADFVADSRAATPTAAAELLSPDRRELALRLNSLRGRLHSSARRLQQQAGQRLLHLGKRLRHPDQQLQQYSQRLDQLDSRLQRTLSQQWQQRRAHLQYALQRLLDHSPQRHFSAQRRELRRLQQRLQRGANNAFHSKQQALQRLSETLDVVSPLATLQRGYAIVSDRDGEILRSARQLKRGDNLSAKLAQGSVDCKVEKISG